MQALDSGNIYNLSGLGKIGKITSYWVGYRTSGCNIIKVCLVYNISALEKIGKITSNWVGYGSSGCNIVKVVLFSFPTVLCCLEIHITIDMLWLDHKFTCPPTKEYEILIGKIVNSWRYYGSKIWRKSCSLYTSHAWEKFLELS